MTEIFMIRIVCSHLILSWLQDMVSRKYLIRKLNGLGGVSMFLGNLNSKKKKNKNKNLRSKSSQLLIFWVWINGYPNSKLLRNWVYDVSEFEIYSSYISSSRKWYMWIPQFSYLNVHRIITRSNAFFMHCKKNKKIKRPTVWSRCIYYKWGGHFWHLAFLFHLVACTLSLLTW